MRYKNKLYFIWSGRIHDNDGFPQHLFIAEMSSSIKVSSNVYSSLLQPMSGKKTELNLREKDFLKDQKFWSVLKANIS